MDTRRFLNFYEQQLQNFLAANKSTFQKHYKNQKPKKKGKSKPALISKRSNAGRPRNKSFKKTPGPFLNSRTAANKKTSPGQICKNNIWTITRGVFDSVNQKNINARKKDAKMAKHAFKPNHN
ncbi:hypothetical protein GGTG_11245 [Gaeumannomyces tritici R3-111a-1]|uniref:Uncharacterized protein n=1 Tax=Gaeumannomyces tritici (strain R3-111a-1) TaxID=644352 RepID=J3PCM5_GAET3|nr:hypothetical protein GGTG_11245 [Gaeumannomyces tritici R3-111a-1]EJT71995.1 hypothetical protein GGTG_11245 [Gaeumannomyces tritici R3-111a-1]